MELALHKGDITTLTVDAIVNAANSSLYGGGGVDGAIHRAGGPAILAECRELRASGYGRGLPAGEAVATTAGDLPAQWVIHTVGPVHSATEDRSATLHSCYRRSLEVAADLGARTIAFPLISAGAYRWPIDEAIAIARAEIAAARNDGLATLVLFTGDTYRRAEEIISS
jgi:O-acetyl-ADP-ribose deacetylase (regulator of RNase III)